MKLYSNNFLCQANFFRYLCVSVLKAKFLEQIKVRKLDFDCGSLSKRFKSQFPIYKICNGQFKFETFVRF